MADMAADNPVMADYLELTTGASITESYLATMVVILALTAGAFGVWAGGHPGADEDEGQLDLVLAGPVSRTRSLTADVVATLTGTTTVLVAGAAGLALGQLAATNAADSAEAFGAQLAYLPAVLTLVGIVVLIYGWLPDWGWVGWVVLAFVFVIGWLGGLLDPPRWIVDLSPYSHVPRVPIESAAGWSLPVLCLVGLGLVALGLVGFRRRDVGVS
jgi:ABC-2 type transport system permease protein